jgi:hypothetical protein
MTSRWLLLPCALLAASTAGARCYTVGSITTCTAQPGVTITESGAPGRTRIVSSNASSGINWERHLVNEPGYSYSFGTDPEGNRWFKAEQRQKGSVFTLWPNTSRTPAAAPQPGVRNTHCASDCQ